MSDALYVNELTPEEAMNILRFYGEKIILKSNEIIRPRPG